ncbi:hypothetical protein [Microbacterium kyungheense]|uniref:hypothetical protein n=1 Tax=Microbacterium kyungheense TaxID=1263636 RepID=UPI001FEBCB5D|nr:hypothetical protein [Microbacterium kyungheense]
MDIMLGTSARVGECIGLRRKDVDMTTSPSTVLVDGTIVSTKKQGLHRKDAPKRARSVDGSRCRPWRRRPCAVGWCSRGRGRMRSSFRRRRGGR